MVAVIKSAANIKNALQYNENKLKLGHAKLIHSNNYPKATDQLGFSDKLRTLEKLMALNERTKLKSVHISLNFDPSEKIPEAIYQQIADSYMQQIGFGNQPYLVYQHFDAGHPHMHIVTTNIRWDGTRIKMQNIGRNESEKARLQIEKTFGLVQAQSHARQTQQIKPVNIQKLQYGKSDTRRAITNVLDAVLPVYKYSSLPELNAVLKLYNVMADGGKENSRTFQNKGLLYRVLNEKGEGIGIPIKASQIHNKPTLAFLESKFAQNKKEKLPHQTRLKNRIDLSFASRPHQSFDEFIKSMQKDGVHIIVRQNEQGFIYGITYVDHQTKCVFNGSELGKAYSAKQILERCHFETTLQKKLSTASEAEIKSGLWQASNEKGRGASVDALIVEASLPGSLKELVLLATAPEAETGLAAELKQDNPQQKKKRKPHH